MQANIRLYPWFRFFQGLIFWQAVWFLFFQGRLSAAEAILIYAIYDISTTVLEVPSGWLSDRIGRRITLVLAAVSLLVSCVMQAIGGGFWVYALAQIPLGAAMAFASGTDSSLLYESLSREGRGDEIETHEVRAWRFSFSALAFSAVTGGALSLLDDRLPFVATALAAAFMLGITLRFSEPPHTQDESASTPPGSILSTMSNPVLVWCFVLALSMYAFSHVPFVFGQPFILEALSEHGFAADAPLVSGAITTLMMLLSLGTSWFAPGLRARIGLGGILLLALGMQVALIGALAWSNHIFIVALLLLRMVPDSLARPFLLARIQPLLADGYRATYLSFQSLCGRLVFALSLIAVSFDASSEAAMPYAEIQTILFFYVVAGLGVLAGLVLFLRRARLESDAS